MAPTLEKDLLKLHLRPNERVSEEPAPEESFKDEHHPCWERVWLTPQGTRLRRAASSPEQLSQSIPYAQIRGRNGHYRPPNHVPDERTSRAPSPNKSQNSSKRGLGKVM